MQLGIHIHFAHRTFKWNNEGKGVAAVHCVIVGMGLDEPASPVLYDYAEDISGEPEVIEAKQINPYLVDAPMVILPSRTTAPKNLPQLIKGSQPTDGGYLILSEDERIELLANEPSAEKWIRPYMGGEEFINAGKRFCLWLKNISPTELRAMPAVMKRVEQVAKNRLLSPTSSVKDCAKTPTLFTQDRQPEGGYLAIPEVSSERRLYIPIGFLSKDIIASSKLQIIPKGTLYHFGVLSSTIHNAWMRAVCGRLKSDYSYSPSVYNNFPWPQAISDKALQAIESAAQGVLDARAEYPDSSLADLYDPNTMPPVLTKAHQTLDKAVDAAYKYKGGKEDAPRVAFLFERYQALTSLLPVEKAKRKVTRK